MRSTYLFLTAILFFAGVFSAAAQPGARVSGNTAQSGARVSGNTAQSGARVSGSVGDAKGQPIESATISLLHAADSSRVQQTATDKSGHFRLDHVPAGKYLVAVSSVGFRQAYSIGFELEASTSRTLPPIVLMASAGDLQTVAVVAKKPFIEQKADKMIINVDASPSNAGSTAMDVLEKSPGVTLDKDDNISLKGKQGVTIMIDNKPTYLSASQLASYLRSLPASAIDQIELMTNPSAKYDAAGNSGIINIRTKKNKMKGFNGNVNLTYSQGVYPKPSGSVNLNYRNGKANFFLNGGYSNFEGFQQLLIGRTYLDQDGKTVNSIFSQTTNMHFRNPGFNLKFGMDYYLTNKTTVGFVVSGFANKEDFNSTSTIQLQDPSKILDSVVYSPSTNNTTWKNGSVNLNFRHAYDSAGRELTADMDYVRYSSVSDQYFDNLTYAPDMTLLDESILTGHLPSAINIYTLKTDYTRPLTHGYKLETGIKLSYVNTDNTADYYNQLNKVDVVDTTKTNHFLYRENINAAYATMTKQFKKLTVQVGVRAENTNYNGHQLGNGLSVINRDSTFSRSYVSLFPTAYLTYTVNDKNQLTLNYGRRIDRPAYQDLNPFLFFLDQYTYQAGNPYLQPQFTHNVELSHTYRQFLTTTLNYSYTQDFFSETFEQSGQATIVRNGNIGSRQNAGISVSAQLHPARWWTAIIYSNLNYSQFNGILYGEPLNVSATNLLLNVNNQFMLHGGWSGEISGFYRTKGVEGQVVVYPMGQASAAVLKKILKDKASLKLAVRDIFYTNQVHGYINFQQTEATFHNKRDTRQVALTFSWNFGKPLKGMSGNHNHSGAGDEESRVKTGGNN